MSLDGISLEQTSSPDFFSTENTQVQWGEYGIQELDEKSQPAILRALNTRHQGHSTLQHRKEHIKPMMSRPPDTSEASVQTGYNKDDGFYVEGQWTWSWDNTSNDKEKSADNDTKDTDHDSVPTGS